MSKEVTNMSSADSAASEMCGILEQNIKDVIARHPSVGQVLSEFNVACVTCNVGTCKVKDVVAIHSMSPQQEDALFRQMANIIFPGKVVEIPRLERKALIGGGKKSFSPPMKELVEEHTWIKRVLALIPVLMSKAGTPLTEADKVVLRQVVDFVRNFADRFHHAKEEDLLFKYFDSGSEIIQSMLKEHEVGRGHIRAALEAIACGETTRVGKHLSAYAELLKEHIRKEDEILYPWMDGQLTDSQVGKLYSQSGEVNGRFGAQPDQYRAWVTALESSNK